jgi:hypothetical protein
MKTVLKILILALLLTVAGEATAQWKKNFGGSGTDYFRSVTAVSDGIIAVGDSRDVSFGNGDWGGVEGKGNYDGIVVKYNNEGNIVWKKNFGGSSFDYFYGVITVSDGIIAVGESYAFGNGDWTGVTGKGNGDATIVKFDNVGNVVWKKNFGGSADDLYESVIAVSDGIIAVGWSQYGSFGNGDWVGVTGYDTDAIIVKYDHNGNVLWKKSFGTDAADYFHSVTAVSDGIIAVGYKMGTSTNDAIIVKYDNAGNLVWDKTLGGSDSDEYYGITTVSDGVIAVGDSYSGSFGHGVWAGIPGKGGTDAIIVKYDNAGNVLWKKNFGGSDPDYYRFITMVSDGFIAVGYAFVLSAGDGDWTGLTGKGATDAIIVKYDFNGNVLWKKNFGGKGYDKYHSVVAAFDGIFAAGESYDLLGSGSSFGNGDLEGVTGKGAGDAIIVKYTDGSSGITDAPTISNLKVYPNPTNNNFFVECENGNAIKVYDMLGKEIFAQLINGKTEINISHLSKGIYNISDFSEGRVIGNSKIVKY